MDMLNLAVSIAAISISIMALIFSYLWSRDSQRCLHEARDSLQKVTSSLEGINRVSDQINTNVQDRMDSLITRLLPTGEEKAQTEAISKFFENAFNDPKMFNKLLQIGLKQNK